MKRTNKCRPRELTTRVNTSHIKFLKVYHSLSPVYISYQGGRIYARTNFCLPSQLQMLWTPCIQQFIFVPTQTHEYNKYTVTFEAMQVPPTQNLKFKTTETIQPIYSTLLH